MDDSIRREMLALLPRLRRFAYGFTGKWDTADDLVQSTYVRAIEAIESWTAGTRLDAWLFRILRNLYLNERRYQALREQRSVELDLVVSAIHDGERDVMARLTFEQVRQAVAGLPEAQRTALLVVTVEGFSYEEASTLLDEPVGTVASRVGRARQSLTALIHPKPDRGPSVQTVKVDDPVNEAQG